jgi:hypothetical protein
MLYHSSYTCDASSLKGVKKILTIAKKYLTALHQSNRPELFASVSRQTMDVVQDSFVMGCCYQVEETQGAELIWQALCDFIEAGRTGTLIHRPPMQDDRASSPWSKWQARVGHSRVFSWNLLEEPLRPPPPRQHQQPSQHQREQTNFSLVFNRSDVRHLGWDVIPGRWGFSLKQIPTHMFLSSINCITNTCGAHSAPGVGRCQQVRISHRHRDMPAQRPSRAVLHRPAEGRALVHAFRGWVGVQSIV